MFSTSLRIRVYFDQLLYEQDAIRAVDEVYASKLDMWIERDFRALGYNVVRVPVTPPVERLEFILGVHSDGELI